MPTGTRPFRTLPCLLAIAVLLPPEPASGMAGHTERTPQLTVRDSAGVIIFENPRPAPGSRLGWRVGRVPSLSIGTREGDEPYLLYGVEDATRLGGGRIAVANSASGEIRVFAPDGTHLASWGGIGEGPGEFAQWDPEAVSAWPGDSVIAAAWWRGRIEVFDAEGRHGRTATLAEGRFSFADLLPGGTIVAKPSLLIGIPFGAADGTLARREEEFALVGSGGELHVSLGTHAGEEWFVSPSSPSARPHPFGRSVLAAAWGDLAIVTANDRYEVRAYSTDGRLARIVRRDHDLRTPTQAELDNWVQDRYGDLPEERRERMLAQMEGITAVEHYPAFSAVHSDPHGYLWVRDYNLPGQDRNLWTVFDLEGRVLGFVEMPFEAEVYEIGADYILGGTEDEMGVERVGLWALDRVR